MEIGDGRCFATSLSFSFSLPFSFSSSLHPSPSFFSPPRFRRALRPSSFYRIQPTLIHTCTYIHRYTHTKCILCFRSRSMYHPSILSPPFRLALFLLPFCSFLLRAHGLPYVCPDLKIVWLVPGRGVPNELEIRSQLRARER